MVGGKNAHLKRYVLKSQNVYITMMLYLHRRKAFKFRKRDTQRCENVHSTHLFLL